MSDNLRGNASIADALWLVAGIALALTVWRGIMAMPIWSGIPDSLQWYYFQALGTVAFLAPMSLTLLVIGLRQTRPGAPRFVAPPASLVGFSVTFILSINTTLLLLPMLLVGWPLATFTGGKVFYYCRLLAEQTGMAIGAGWFIQLLGRQYRKSTGWVDITSTFLGLCWIGLAMISVVFTLL